MAPKSVSNPQSSEKEEELEQPTSSEERVDEQESAEEEEEEENSSGEEDEDSSEEEDRDKEPEILPKSIAQENGSDSKPESDDSPSAYKIQPIPKTSITAAKRKNQEISNGDNSSKSNKRTKAEEKKASVVSSPPGVSGYLTRLWSNGDETALLNCMVDFKKSKNTDFGGAFYDAIKGKLQVDFSKEQLRTKISRMKKRHLNALKKGQNGLDPVFSKPHDVMVFELSKKIWGGESGKKNDSSEGVWEQSKKDTIKEKKIVRDEEEMVKNKKDGEEGLIWSKYQFFSSSFDNLVGKFPSLGMSDSGISLVKEKLSFIGNAKAKELNEKWKQMLVEETELHYKMMSLMREQIKLALDQ